MSLQGDVEVKTIELRDALEFTALRESSAIEGFLAPAFALIVLCWFWFNGNLWIRILTAIGAAWTVAAGIADRVHGGETTLRITIEGVIANGNLGHFWSTHEQVGIVDLAAIRYHPGDGEGETAGLYAHLDWGRRMLLPNISAEQANVIIEAIRQKFPGIPAEPYAPFSFSDLSIFDRGDLITLRLSSHENAQQGRSSNFPEANS